MKCVILCGGKGYRLREETEFRPKPMVPIGGKPIIEHIMEIYMRHGVNDFVLCLGYKGEMIREYYAGLSNHPGRRVTMVDTGEETLTGGRIRQIEPYVKGENFHLTYGDGLANIDLGELRNRHLVVGPVLTLTSVAAPSRFGEITVSPRGMIYSFNEKRTGKQRINGGFMVCAPAVFDYLDRDEPFERVPMERIVNSGKAFAFHHNGFWHAMDTYADYIELNKLCENGRASWTV